MNLLVFKQKIKQQAIVVLLTLAVNLLNAQANYIMKNNGSGTPVNTGMLFEYNGDYIGIGTVTPGARLHINQTSITPQPDYFAITKTASYPTPVTTTYFMVNGDGMVGIGTASPSAPLEVKINHWYTPGPSFGDNVIAFKDPDDNVVGALLNVDVDGTHPGGALALLAGGEDGRVSLAIVNTYNYTLPFGVLDDGTIAAGGSLGSFVPEAQFNIVQRNPYDYLVKLQSTGQTNDYFTIHNDGYVGIGYANSGNATLQVVTPSGATGTAGVVITGNAPNNRFLYVGSGSSPATGPTYLTVKNTGVGVGIDDLSNGAQLAVKGSSGTKLDLMETSSTVNYNAQIRFISSDGTTVRHLITEDASGNLLINAGFAGGSDKVKVDGSMHVTNKVQIGNTAPSGSYTGYMLGVDGDIVAKKVIVQTGSWADKVFAPNYNLRSLADVEAFIKQNNHLPEIPAESEVMEKGSDVGEMNVLLLQKVEELTLYLIDLQKQIDELKK